MDMKIRTTEVERDLDDAMRLVDEALEDQIASAGEVVIKSLKAVKQLIGDKDRVLRFGTWESWSPEDTNYLLGELRHRLVEDCPFPSYHELVVVAIDARQNAPVTGADDDEVLGVLLELAQTVSAMTSSSVADEVVLLLDRHLVKQGFPSVGHIPVAQGSYVPCTYIMGPLPSNQRRAI